MKRWVISGTVYYADGFDFEIDAETEDQARAEAERIIETGDAYQPDPQLQEICIETVQVMEHNEE
jgi:conjugal transfer/entry exclusion protein